MSESRGYRRPLMMVIALLGASLLSSSATALSLVNIVSRKIHGSVGAFDLPVNPSGTFNSGLSIEPRAIGSGHLIVFTFDEAVTLPGTVTVFDALGAPIGNTAPPVVNVKEVSVNIADVPDRRSVKVTLTGVTAASGTINATASLGFLMGSFSDASSVTARDTSASKARSGQPIDVNSFRYDVNISGLVSAADIATIKTRVGLTLVTGSLPMAWGRGGWDQDVWQ